VHGSGHLDDGGVVDGSAISLRRVCLAWDATVCSTPSLWSSLTIVMEFGPRASYGEPTESARTMQDLTRNILQYSNQRPLNISIVLSTTWGFMCLALLPGFEERLRWRRLSLSIPEDHIGGDTQLNGYLSGDYPLLETLEIFIHPNLANPHVPRSWFSNAPRLRAVEFRHTNPSMFPLPWAQLESLSIHQVGERHMNECHEILEQATSLQRLCCKFDDYVWTTRQPLRPLQVISLEVHSDFDIEYF